MTILFQKLFVSLHSLTIPHILIHRRNENYRAVIGNYSSR